VFNFCNFNLRNFFRNIMMAQNKTCCIKYHQSLHIILCVPICYSLPVWLLILHTNTTHCLTPMLLIRKRSGLYESSPATEWISLKHHKFSYNTYTNYNYYKKSHCKFIQNFPDVLILSRII
jgi:hypothetical protein